MVRLLAVPLVVLAGASFHSSSRPLTSHERAQIKAGGAYHSGCPVGLSQLRNLSVTYRGFDGHSHQGHLVVNQSAVAPLSKAFRRLYELHFRIHHLSLSGVYGKGPADGDPTGSFECRQAVPSPCVGGTGTGSWSMHAYGLAVDINPVENPYVGCGQSRDPKAQKFRDRSVHRTGMVTSAVVRAFKSVGWGWGGSWAGNTKDYMHFSSTGH